MSSSTQSSSTSTPSIVDTKETQKPIKDINYNLINAMSHILESLIKENVQYAKSKKINKKYSVYNNKYIPGISITDYLYRIVRYTEISSSSLILALIYIDRICNDNSIILTYYNIHRLLFSSIMLAIKYNEDYKYNFNFYAEVAGMKVKELSQLEQNFFIHIGCNLYVDSKEFQKYSNYLLNKYINYKDKYVIIKIINLRKIND